MKAWKQILPKALVIFLIFTVVCGIFYTGAVTGLAQLLFPDQANGSIIEVDGKKYGCELLGQQYTDDAHMWGRIMNVDVSTYTDENGTAVMYACLLYTSTKNTIKIIPNSAKLIISGSGSQDHVQDPDLCLFPKYLFIQKNRNCLQTGYQLYVAACRAESAGSQYDCPLPDLSLIHICTPPVL